MICLNCKESMKLIHMRDLVDGEAFPNRKRLIALMDGRSTNEIYMCGSCGKLEFPHLPEKQSSRTRKTRKDKKMKFEPVSQANWILLERDVDAVPTNINTLLKIIPGKIGLQEVITKIRYPIDKKVIESGILLDFKSHTVERPHKILFDPTYQDVKLLAIHNDKNAFDLKNLSSAYGKFEYAQRIEEYRFWFFDRVGVAFVTPANDDDEIVYVQFFEERVWLERYIELQCFFEETFM